MMRSGTNGVEPNRKGNLFPPKRKRIFLFDIPRLVLLFDFFFFTLYCREVS